MAASALLGAAATANATIVNVTVTGPVNFNVIQGEMAPVPDGAPVSMSFNVDSNVFTNSSNFPTRGYNIDLSSFAMTVGGVNVPIVTPTPSGLPAYFVLRNNDPAVDGFFISDGNVDNPFPLAVNIPGLTPVHELDFRIGYNNATQISSLDTSMPSARMVSRTSAATTGPSAGSATPARSTTISRSRSRSCRSPVRLRSACSASCRGSCAATDARPIDHPRVPRLTRLHLKRASRGSWPSTTSRNRPR